jgi:hypothetical protein
VVVVVVVVGPDADRVDVVGGERDVMTNPQPRAGSSSARGVETKFDELVVGPLATGVVVVGAATVLVVTPRIDTVEVVVGAATGDGPRAGDRDRATPVVIRAIATNASTVRNGHRRAPRGEGEMVIHPTVTVEFCSTAPLRYPYGSVSVNSSVPASLTTLSPRPPWPRQHGAERGVDHASASEEAHWSVVVTVA